MALHLGSVLGIPSMGVTERTLLAAGEPPSIRRGSTAPLLLEGALVGYWVRTRTGIRPVAAHAGWMTDPKTASLLALATARRARTPQPLRLARRAARAARGRARLSSRE